MACYPPTFESGTNTRLFVASNLTGTPTWVEIGGETSAKLDVKPQTADATNKDSSAGMKLPTGYDWTMAGDAQWDDDDPGQVLIRAMPLGLIVRRIAFFLSSTQKGYYGYGNVGWSGDAGDRNIKKISITVDGCGELIPQT